MTMDDQDLERALGRYRPVGPSGELRARIVAPPPVEDSWRRRALAWLPAAAALVVIVLLHLFASRTYGELSRDADAPARQLRQDQIESLTIAFGGGEVGRAEAERVLADISARAVASPLAGAAPSEGASR